jgi:hypothetical protein
MQENEVEIFLRANAWLSDGCKHRKSLRARPAGKSVFPFDLMANNKGCSEGEERTFDYTHG